MTLNTLGFGCNNTIGTKTMLMIIKIRSAEKVELLITHIIQEHQVSWYT